MPVVLIVEDNNVLRRMLLEQLKKLGIKSHCVNNGKEAVQAATNNPDQYKLVLMDVHMPVMDGITATKLIRSHEKQAKTPRVPIVAVTATDSRDSCMAAGMDDFVHKPCIFEKLRTTIDHWLAPHLIPEPAAETDNYTDQNT